MARTESRTVRFTRVLERAGQPHVHTLWLPPDKDPELKRARNAHRVMTLERVSGSGRTDFGVVGFDPQRDKGRQLLIFPKSLEPFEGARIIGVKFDLIAQPKVSPATAPRAKAKPKTKPARETKTPRARSEAPADKPPSPPSRARRGAARTDKAEHTAPKTAAADSPQTATDTALLREVRAAMKELQRGKAIAAYQRLERAVADADES